MSEPRERLKLRKWLENQIDSRDVPGLRWLDAERTTFRVLWKHAGKPDFVVDKDAVLFREWARHTKRFQEGDQPDPSTWKTRFRCALNKMPDIKEVKVADSLNGSEPYRVFKFIKSDEVKNVGPTRRSTPNKTGSHTFPELVSHTDTRNQDMNFQPNSATGDYRSDVNDWCSIEPTLPPLILRNNNHMSLYSDDDCFVNQREIGIVDHALVTQGSTEYDGSPMEMRETSLNIASENKILMDFLLKKEAAEQLVQCSSHTQQELHHQSAFNSPSDPSLLTELTILQKATETQTGTSQSNQIAQDMPDESDLLIKAFYDNKVVAENKVWFQNRLRMCRLYYGCYDAIFNIEDAEAAFNMIYGPAAAEQIPLPNKELEVPEVKRVLENMNRGLVLELSENRDIYALRLCRCKVFYSTGSQEPQKLERETKTKVFDYRGTFVPALCNSVAGICATPSYEVTFTLGYPNGSLVMIVITHAHAKRAFQVHGSKENLCSEPNADDVKAMHIQINSKMY